MHGGKILLPLLLSVLVVFSSGCISDPTAFARAIPMVNDFLEEHPNAELSIVHYSASEAEGILDQVKEDCGKLTVEAKEFYFINLTDPSTGLVVRAWIDWEGKIVECVFKEGIIVDPENCTSLHRSACFGDHVFWYDSCGNREDKKEYCPLGCSNGECIGGRVCDTDASYREKPNCSCPDGYEMVVLYLRCANSITGAITGMPFAVTDATAQKAVTVESGQVMISSEFTTNFEERCPGESPVYRCVKRERCRSHAQSMCYKGHVFWFDSCGHVQEKKEYCENGCEQGFCKGVRTCEEMGGYCIYPTSASGGGSTSTASTTDSVTGMIQAETVSTSVCREGYEKASYYCPYSGVCCAPEKEPCRSQYEHRCYEGHVYWYDSCGNRENKSEYCEHGCENGACIEAKCAAEGEYTSGAVAPEYQYGCCEGLESFDPWPENWVGGGMLCYDPAKGEPECMYAGTGDEGWYYPDGKLLIKADCQETECRDENYQCSIEDIACCAGLVEVPMAGMENGTCIAATCGSICRPCGNGICEDNENACNCPEDCG